MAQRLQVLKLERRAARTDWRDMVNFLSPFTLTSSAPGLNAKNYFAEPLPCHRLINGTMVFTFAPPVNFFMPCGFVRLASALDYQLFASGLGAVSEGSRGHDWRKAMESNHAPKSAYRLASDSKTIFSAFRNMEEGGRIELHSFTSPRFSRPLADHSAAPSENLVSLSSRADLRRRRS